MTFGDEAIPDIGFNTESVRPCHGHVTTNDSLVQRFMDNSKDIVIDEGGCGSSEPFALRVMGDSMEPEFKDGSIIVIDPSGFAENGAYVIAKHEDEYIFRQLVIEDGRHLLKAVNDGYPILEISGPEAVEGVIVQRTGTRRSEHKHYL